MHQGASGPDEVVQAEVRPRRTWAVIPVIGDRARFRIQDHLFRGPVGVPGSVPRFWVSGHRFHDPVRLRVPVHQPGQRFQGPAGGPRLSGIRQRVIQEMRAKPR